MEITWSGANKLRTLTMTMQHMIDENQLPFERASREGIDDI